MDVKDVVRGKYADAARRVTRGETGCCGSGCCGSSPQTLDDPITSRLYDDRQVADLPQEAVQASLGCGNPTALARLHPGEVVLDLGSGGGIDVLLSARRVGPTGKAYGLDMTDEMLALARENQRKAGLEHVEFLKGEIEHVPLPDNSVDVIISNCVINLSLDKDRVFAEAFRVLRPGGRVAVSDVVVRGNVPQEIRRNMELWVGCVAGALEESDYHAKLARAGFEGIDIEPTRIYDIEDARQFLSGHGMDVDAVAPLVKDRFMSAFIRARKPAAGHRGRHMPQPAATAPEDKVRAAVLRRLLWGEPLDLAYRVRLDGATVFALGGDVLTLSQAVRRAREIFGSTIGLVRGVTRKHVWTRIVT